MTWGLRAFACCSGVSCQFAGRFGCFGKARFVKFPKGRTKVLCLASFQAVLGDLVKLTVWNQGWLQPACMRKFWQRLAIFRQVRSDWNMFSFLKYDCFICLTDILSVNLHFILCSFHARVQRHAAECAWRGRRALQPFLPEGPSGVARRIILVSVELQGEEFTCPTVCELSLLFLSFSFSVYFHTLDIKLSRRLPGGLGCPFLWIMKRNHLSKQGLA